MRTFETALLTALLMGCAGAPEKKTYREDAAATGHLQKGRALFASAEAAPVPSEALAAALAELAQAVKIVPSPEHRFAHARVALILDVEDKSAREELGSCVEEAPEDARFLALQAFVDAWSAVQAREAGPLKGSVPEKVEKALSIAVVATAREVRAFVGDEAADCAGIIQQVDVIRAANLVVKAAELGSPRAQIDEAKIHWLARGPAMDRKKALALVEQAASPPFTAEEIGRGLLWGLGRLTRYAACELGSMHAEDGEWTDAVGWYAKAFPPKGTLLDSDGAPDAHAIVAFARFGAIEVLGLAGAKEKERGTARLEITTSLGFVPASLLLAQLDGTRREAIFAAAKKKLSPGAFAGAGDFAGLEELATTEMASAHNAVKKLEWQRLVFLAQAVQKGGGVRGDVEKAAREAVDVAPENTTFMLARQFRHVAGDLSAEDLQKTMPKSAHVPLWRAETELALATRCLLLDDKGGAKDHFKAILDAGAIFSVEDEVAWGALQVLKARE